MLADRDVNHLRLKVIELEGKLERANAVIGAAMGIGQPPWYVMAVIETRESLERMLDRACESADRHRMLIAWGLAVGALWAATLWMQGRFEG